MDIVYANASGVEPDTRAVAHRDLPRARGAIPARARGARRAAWLACVGALAACGPLGAPLVNPGVSDVPQEAPRRLAPDAGQSVAWKLLEAAKQYAAVTRVPYRSHGHFEGRWTAEVLADPKAAERYTSLDEGTAFPEGSVLLQKLRESANGGPGPWFAMQKQARGYYPEGGDWSYAVVDTRGNVEQEGRLVTCARCHAEAPVDWVYGLPAEAKTP